MCYVDDDAAPGGDGLAWSTAFDDLQPALAAAIASGGVITEIRVAQGTYIPSQLINPDDARTATFQLVSGVTLRGGYAGIGSAAPDTWDPETYTTTLSGNLGQSLQALHVVYSHALTATTLFEGFRVADGHALLDDTEQAWGGGLLAIASTLTISRCIFTNNQAGWGGGTYIRDSDVTVTHCTFESNESSHFAGAIRLYSTTASIADSEFVSNRSGESGGAIATTSGGSTEVQRCVFDSNESVEGVGGGICDTSGSPIVLEDLVFLNNSAIVGGGADLEGPSAVHRCQFVGNSSEFGGGGLVITGSISGSGDPCEITNSIFESNTVAWYGGAMLATGGSEFRITNCTMRNNTAGEGGGGVFLQYWATLVNCTIVGNDGSGIMTTPTALALNIQNCIIQGNLPGQITIFDGEPPSDAAPTITVSHSNIQDGWTGPGEGNIDANPMLIQSGCGNLRLAHDSPCLNAGSNAGIPAGITTDLDGNPRIQDNVVDIGAYEGSHDMLPPVACADDVDAWEIAWMLPVAPAHDPLQHPGIRFRNVSDSDDAHATLDVFTATTHPPSDGALGMELQLTASLPDGDHITRAFLPFTLADIGARDPLDINPTSFDARLNRWRVAPAGNLASSPGHSSTIGDRFTHVDDGEPYSLSPEIGDYGVVWNPVLLQGYVWANLDHASDFAFGVPLPECIADCAQPPDGVVDGHDMLAVLNAWGAVAPGTPTDIDQSGVVDIMDLLGVLAAFGPCP